MFEAAGVAYDDVARRPVAEGGGIPAMQRLLADAPGLRPLAPPVLVHGARVIAQSAVICDYLAPLLGLVPEDEDSRLAARQLAATVADLVNETHDTHHPVASGWHYEQQRPEAAKRAAHFLEFRLPKFLAYFEAVLGDTDGPFLLGETLSYPDLSLFHTVDGIAYGFPNGWARVAAQVPRVRALCAQVQALEPVAAYLASERRLPFNEMGIFRRYPELDPA
jgi:glutathione S-transferase